MNTLTIKIIGTPGQIADLLRRWAEQEGISTDISTEGEEE